MLKPLLKQVSFFGMFKVILHSFVFHSNDTRSAKKAQGKNSLCETLHSPRPCGKKVKSITSLQNAEDKTSAYFVPSYAVKWRS